MSKTKEKPNLKQILIELENGNKQIIDNYKVVVKFIDILLETISSNYSVTRLRHHCLCGDKRTVTNLLKFSNCIVKGFMQYKQTNIIYTDAPIETEKIKFPHQYRQLVFLLLRRSYWTDSMQ